MLRDLRGRLLHLHKVLLDDARATYEMDRGRVPSNYSLLQLVINDPWFAWLHALSELVVRIDQTVEPEAPATAADGAALVDQVERLLTPSETGEGLHGDISTRCSVSQRSCLHTPTSGAPSRLCAEAKRKPVTMKRSASRLSDIIHR